MVVRRRLGPAFFSNDPRVARALGMVDGMGPPPALGDPAVSLAAAADAVVGTLRALLP